LGVGRFALDERFSVGFVQNLAAVSEKRQHAAPYFIAYFFGTGKFVSASSKPSDQVSGAR
jgi:hypothetical protein